MAMYKGETKIKDIYVGTEPIVKVYAGEEFCGFFTLSAYNLVANSDLLIDSNSDNVPDGFTYGANTTDISLTNGIAKFTATAQFGQIYYPLNNLSGQTIYSFGRFKADGAARLHHNQSKTVTHSGSGQFEFLSLVEILDNNVRQIQIGDFRASGFTSIEVDYMGAINITDLVSRGILPSGLTNAQYKEILDNYFNS